MVYCSNCAHSFPFRWMIALKSMLATAGSSAVGGRATLDVSKCSWQKLSKKGRGPSPRSGAVMAYYKNKGILFGGVHDEEGPRHSIISTFFNDMYAFDTERRRWYQLGLKTPADAKARDAAAAEKRERRRARKLAGTCDACAVRVSHD